MAERSNAAVLKTVEGNTSGGSNPSLSAQEIIYVIISFFIPLLLPFISYFINHYP